MKRPTNIGVWLSVMGILLMASVAFSANPKGGADTPVTSLIAGAGLPDDPTGFQIQSDGKGSYKNATDGVGSVLQKGTIQEWQLDTSASTARNVYLDFQFPVSGTATAPPFAHGQVPTRIETKCYVSNSIGPGNMTGLNSTLDCVLLIAFNYGGKLEPSDTVDDFPGVGVVYLRIAWSYIEPQEGQFTWSVLDTPAQRWLDKGKQIALRISCSESFMRYATPEWVRLRAGVPGKTHRSNSDRCTQQCPQRDRHFAQRH